ncbi:hypothetical protein SLS58_000661 [Diplodia intermedia]|uniref:Uncharacterized protein n=1 Tax=Diplodia intermedia TaxID=856260 RepID=A0ABR3U5J5_9PEZI
MTTTPTPATVADNRPAAAPEPSGPPRFVRGSVVPHLDTSTPAINAGAPVEIDGTPTSPDQAKQRIVGGGSGALSAAGGVSTTVARKRGEVDDDGAGDERPPRCGSSPDHLAREGEVLEEFGLSGPPENRAALLQSRKSDPAVLVDIPQGPSVEDFAAAGLLSPAVDDKKVEAAV